MIGKIRMGSSFRGCINYCLNDKIQDEQEELVMKNRAEILSYHLCCGNATELISQFKEVRELNMKLSKPVMHISLSLAPGDILNKGKMMEMVEDCAVQLGFDKNQYLSILHKDTSHQHIHIVANRIGLDGRTISDSNNFQKMAKYCRSMELKYGLKQVLSPRKFLSKEQRLLERQDIRKEKLKEHIRLSIRESKNMKEFEDKMKKLGYEIIKGRGIAFRDKQKVYTKGSEVGYSLKNIEKQLQQQYLVPSIKAEQKITIIKQEKRSLSPKPWNDTNKGHVKKCFHALNKMLNEVMKPEMEFNQVPYELKQYKRQRQKIRH